MNSKIFGRFNRIVSWGLDAAVTAFNLRSHLVRLLPAYSAHFERYMYWFSSGEEMKECQMLRLKAFLIDSGRRSPYYKALDVPFLSDGEEFLSQFPMLEKETLRSAMDISTLPSWRGIVRRTGGTTGRSLQLVLSWGDVAERLAAVDAFWAQFGFKPRKSRVIWCNGRKILSAADLEARRFYRDDHVSRIRYLSSFNLSEKTASSYLKAVIDFEPDFLVGFPSVISEIARWFERLGVAAPMVKAVFPTAEVLTPHARECIRRVFRTEVYDQYASSEGAPFFFECPSRRMHPCEYSGYFEYLPDPVQGDGACELIVTSFSTMGTPLIRYRIGDSVILDHEACECGRAGVSVKSVQGRCNDYLQTPDGRRISVGISSAAKGLASIKEFQLIQRSYARVDLLVVVDADGSQDDVQKLLLNLRERVGPEVAFDVHRVDSIDRDSSGKFRMIKRVFQDR